MAVAALRALPCRSCPCGARAYARGQPDTCPSASNESFLFIKPRLRLGWHSASTRLQATIEREAAQLDFGDFVASAELDRDDILAGARSVRGILRCNVMSFVPSISNLSTGNIGSEVFAVDAAWTEPSGKA